VGQGEAVLDLPKSSFEEMRVITTAVSQAALLETIKIWSQLESDMRFSASARLLVEVALIRSTSWFANTTGPDEAREAPPLPVFAPASGRQAARPAPLMASEPEPARSETPPEPVSHPTIVNDSPETGLVQVWDRVLGLLSQKYRSTHAILVHTKPGPVRGKLATIVVPNEAFFRLVGNPDNKKVIEKALEKVGLEGMTIQPLEANHPMARFDMTVTQSEIAQGPTGETSLLEMAKRVFPMGLVTEIKEE